MISLHVYSLNLWRNLDEVALPLIPSESHQRLRLERTKPAEAPSVSFHVANLTCTDCAIQLVRAVESRKGVKRAELDYVSGQLNVWGKVAPNEVARVVRHMGYEQIDVDTGQVREANRLPFNSQSRFVLIHLSGLFIVGAILLNLYGIRWLSALNWVPLSPASIAYVIAFVLAALLPIRTALYSAFYKVPETNAVVILAGFGVVFMGKWSDAAFLLFFFTIIDMIEARLLDESRYGHPHVVTQSFGDHDQYGPQSVGERIAPYFTRITLIIAFFVAVIPSFFFDMAIQSWLYPALALLILARPGALTISTPAAWMSVSRHASDVEIAVKDRQTWSRLAQVNLVAFDLTGTLTEGRMAVFEIVSCGEAVEGYVLDVALAVLEPVNHPANSALSETALAMERDGVEATSVFEIKGFGAEGYLDGRRCVVGNVPLMRLKGIDLTPLAANIGEVEVEGKSRIVVAENENVIGMITLADIVRDHSLRTIRRLQAMSGMKRVAMITEDDIGIAGEVAERLGLDEYKAGLSPAEKINVINSWQNDGYRVAMVGNGNKNAALMAEAHIGISLGTTSHEQEYADVMITADEPTYVPHLFALARKYKWTTVTNFIVACMSKVVAIYLLATNRLPLGLAALMEMGSSLVVTWRSARLQKRIRMTSRRRKQ